MHKPAKHLPYYPMPVADAHSYGFYVILAWDPLFTVSRDMMTELGKSSWQNEFDSVGLT